MTTGTSSLTMTTPPVREDGSPVPGLAGFAHRVVDVAGTRLHAVVGGSGPTLVLVHGWPFTWASWRRVMPALAASGRTVVAVDLRGTGDSDKPETGYAKADVAEDVHHVVGRLGLERTDGIDLVGTDIGAMVAYTYAVSHPEQVRHLVLAESLLPGFGLEELMNPATGGYWHFGFHMQVDVAEMLTAGKEEAYLTPGWSMSSPGGGLTDADRAEFLAHYSAPGGMRGGFQHYATLLQDGRANRARLQADPRSRLTMPVLVLNGDQGAPQAHLLDGVRQVATDVHADIVPGAGHSIAADNPAWLADRLTRFFATAPASVDAAVAHA